MILHAIKPSSAVPVSRAIGIRSTCVVYLDPEDTVITARSMDWKVDVGTNLGIFAGNATKDFNPTLQIPRPNKRAISVEINQIESEISLLSY